MKKGERLAPGDFVLGPYNRLLLVNEIQGPEDIFCTDNDGTEFHVSLDQISLYIQEMSLHKKEDLCTDGMKDTND